MKIIDKYKKLGAPVKASIWFLVCSVLQKGIALLTTPIFTRIMTDQAYGQFTVYNSWYNILFAIATLNFAAGVFSRGLIKNEEDQDTYTSSMVGLSTLCVAIVFIVYLIFHKAVDQFFELSTFLMVLMFIEIWTNSVFQFWSNRERVNYKYLRLIVVTLLYVTICPILSIVFIINAKLELQLHARVLAICIVCLLLFGLLFVEIVIKGRKLYNREYWLHALKFNIPLLPHYLSQILLNQSDKLMISKMCSMEEAAYYSVVYSIAMILLIVNSSISGTMNPWIYKTIKTGEYNRIANVSYIVLFLIAISEGSHHGLL